MSHPAPSLDRVRVHTTLQTVLELVMPASPQIAYRLVGTAASLLHGVVLPAADVDILVKEREAVETFGAALSPFPCLSAPEWLPEARQYYTNYDVKGVEVGISTVEVEMDSDTVETLGRGPWEHFRAIPVGPYTVPTVALELRLLTELFRDRPDRYEPIIRHLQKTGVDMNLLRRGLDGARISQGFRDRVLRQLQGVALNGETTG